MRVGGVPTFVIDGRPHSGVCYSSYDTHPPRLEARARAFGHAGCGIFNFVVEIAGYGYSRPMSVGPSEWDFGDLDERCGAVLAGAPDAYLLPRIYIDAPTWWRDANPDEMMLLEGGSPTFGAKLFALSRDGDYPSLASPKWRADMRDALNTVIDHIERSPYANRVIGYQLSGQKTEEWYHWSMNCEALGDYSPDMQSAFREWLRARYATDIRLQQAWRRDDVSLASAAIPSQAARYGHRSTVFRDPSREADVIDFHRFWSEVMADAILDFAHAVKVKTQRTKLVGAFYSYTFEFTDLAEDAGHLATWKLLRSPDLDFIMAPSSYYNRNLPGRPYFRSPVTSLHHHGKVLWNDFDQVSYKYYDKLKDDPNLKTWEYQMGLTQTPEEFVWMCRREVGMELAQGVQLAHFDIHGGYYDDPVIMEGVQQLIALREEAVRLPARGSTAQILVLADEDSEHYYSFRNPILTRLLSHQVAELVTVAPYDTALLSDLSDLEVGRYRLVVLPNAVRLDGRQRRLIREKLCRDGRTLLWLHAPGYFADGEGSAASVERLTGVQLAEGALTSPEGGLALRRHEAWVSAYSPGPVLCGDLRSLARDAGVHLYTNDPDVAVFANAHYLTVCADAAGGETTIRLRGPATVADALTGEIVCKEGQAFRPNLRPKEVRILRLRAQQPD
jgi:hypothetical protein